jgi:hypothetical protein
VPRHNAMTSRKCLLRWVLKLSGKQGRARLARRARCGRSTREAKNPKLFSGVARSAAKQQNKRRAERGMETPSGKPNFIREQGRVCRVANSAAIHRRNSLAPNSILFFFRLKFHPSHIAHRQLQKVSELGRALFVQCAVHQSLPGCIDRHLDRVRII